MFFTFFVGKRKMFQREFVGKWEIFAMSVRALRYDARNLAFCPVLHPLNPDQCEFFRTSLRKGAGFGTERGARKGRDDEPHECWKGAG